MVFISKSEEIFSLEHFDTALVTVSWICLLQIIQGDIIHGLFKFGELVFEKRSLFVVVQF